MNEKKSEGKLAIKIGMWLTFLLGVTAVIIGIYEAGIGGLLAIPFGVIALFGSLMGTVPFIGPFLYYFIIKWVFNVIQSGAGIAMPIATGILFYSFLTIATFYCFIATFLVILLILKERT